MCIYCAHKNALQAHFIMTLRHLITKLCELNYHNSDWLLVNWCFFSGCMKSVLDFGLLIIQYLRTQVRLLAQSREALRSAWAAHFCLKTYTRPCIMLYVYCIWNRCKLEPDSDSERESDLQLHHSCNLICISARAGRYLQPLCWWYLTNILYTVLCILWWFTSFSFDCSSRLVLCPLLVEWQR